MKHRTVITALTITLLLTACSSNGKQEDSAADAATNPIEMSAVRSYAVTSAEHTEAPVAYPQIPPVGGDHDPAWQNCGVYETEIADEVAVHSMEHGAVWITYQPGLDSASIAALEGLATNRTHVLVSPYSDLPSPIVASAWTVQLRVDSASDKRLGAFIAAYENGKQTPEQGAPCSGAIGNPK